MDTDKVIDGVSAGNSRGKYYSINAIGISSFLFGPLAGGYMMYKNFNLLGDTSAAKTTRNSFIVGIILFGIYLLLPYKIPFSNALPILFLVIIYSYANKLQKNRLKEYAAAGGQKYSFGKVLGVCCLALLATLVYIFVIVLILGLLFS